MTRIKLCLIVGIFLTAACAREGEVNRPPTPCEIATDSLLAAQAAQIVAAATGSETIMRYAQAAVDAATLTQNRLCERE